MRKFRLKLLRGDCVSIALSMLLLLSTYTVRAQTDIVTVKGTVKDEAGIALPGVSITGGVTALSTKVDGTFAVRAAKGATLSFTSTGYALKTVVVNGAETLNIVLTETKTDLSEVVVVAYGTQKKGSVTGAVSSIQSADLVRTTAATTSGALVGKIQGITARSVTGRPGSTTAIQIRNMGTPLYVIDGIPQSEGQFNQLGIEDIENISVLKDGSAAIYGFRASNGVVLITTKKGKIGEKSTTNISTYFGLQNVTRYMEPASAGDYVRALAEAEQNAGIAPTTTREILQKWADGTEPGFQGTNYKDVIILKNAPQKYLNINTSGATDKMNYFLSLSGIDQQALLKQYNFNRSNFQANLEGTIIKGLKIGAQLSGRIEARHNVASTTNADTYDNPFLAILTMWPTERMYANDNPNYINANINNPSRNPLIYNQDVIGSEDNVWNNFNSIFYTTMQLPFGFSAKATYSYNYKQNRNELFRKSFSTYNYVPATDSYSPVLFNLSLRNKYRQEIKEDFAQFQLNYNKTVGVHSFSAFAAYEYQSSIDQNININSVPPTNTLAIINQTEITTFTNAYGSAKRASFVGRFNYDYKSKYLIEALARYDGNSLYAPGQRFGLFPGVSLGWRVSEEGFIKNNFPVISSLKIRASWGRTGLERGVGVFDYLAGGNYNSGNYVFDPNLVTAGIALRGLPITNISWVTSTNKNIGVDVGLFNSKLTGEFDVFERKLTGIPAARYDVLIPSEVGYTLPLENLNSEKTQGIEGKVTYADRSGKVGYSLSANATLGRRKILDLYKPRFGNSIDEYRNRTDNRWSDINWGYEIIGQFQSMDQIKNYPVNNDNQGNKTLLPGDLIFKDINGDGIINSQDERPIGYATGANPYLSFGFNTAVNYKGFSIMTDWAGASMQSYYRALEMQIPFQGNHNSPDFIFNDRWHRADLFDPNSEWIPGKYPPIRKGTFRTYTANSDFWIKNVQYLRLKNLEVGYTFPKKLVSKIHLTKLKVYFNGTNLFSFDNVKDIQLDPEVSFNSGLVYPNIKIYTFGINLTL